MDLTRGWDYDKPCFHTILRKFSFDKLHHFRKDVVKVEEFKLSCRVSEADIPRLDVLIHTIDERSEKCEYVRLLLSHSC